MSLTISAHGPHQPTTRLYDDSARPFVDLQTDGVSLFIHTRAEASALAEAALTARSLLPACGDIATHTQRSCELDPGHDGWHHSGMITWQPMPPQPEPQPLPADISGDLDAIPANRIGDPGPLPAGHGPNHIDNAGHAVHVTSGVRVPGCVTCEAGTEVAE